MPAAHKPTKKTRKIAKKYSRVGVPQEDIAKVIKISKKTLTKHYKDELELGGIIASAKVANVLYRLCMQENLQAVIFWLKTRAKWRESDSKDIKEEALLLIAAVRAGATLTNENWTNQLVKKGG